MTKHTLVACPACSRHVRAGEAECPFCAASLAGLAPPKRRAHGRLTRLALVAGVALAGMACGSSGTADDSVQEEETVGGEAPPPEQEEPVDEGGGEEEASDDSAPVTMYGGPAIELIV
ncbi:MAG: hypothetical protein M5U28_14740 [Sandaracinaceae bacterium]|nr:hypothetical protein [Sandaracinaceae bacterium]